MGLVAQVVDQGGSNVADSAAGAHMVSNFGKDPWAKWRALKGLGEGGWPTFEALSDEKMQDVVTRSLLFFYCSLIQYLQRLLFTLPLT